MARGRFLLAKEAGRQERAVSSDVGTASARAGKRSKWTSIGGMIGSIGVPMLAAAALGPIGWAGAAMAAGAGSLAGSSIGKRAVGKKGMETAGLTALKGGKGKFFKGTREERTSDIKSLYGQLGKTQLKSALGSAVMAGAMAGGKELASGIKTKVSGVMKGTAGTTDVFTQGKMFGNLTAGGRTQLHGSAEIFGGAAGKAQMEGVKMHEIAKGDTFSGIASSEGLKAGSKEATARIEQLKSINPMKKFDNLQIGSKVRLNKWAPSSFSGMGKYIGGSMAAGAGAYGLSRYATRRKGAG
jgi:hypothetical protein